MRQPNRLHCLVRLAAGICLAAITSSHSAAAASNSDGFTPVRTKEGTLQRTDRRALEQFARALAPDLQGEPGHWTFRKEEVEIAIVSDEAHDRMRVLAPVGDAKKLSAADLATLLDANFDRALDAKYATWRGVVWAVYLHPLSSLTKEEFESAVKQVVALRKNFGTTYSSTSLVFAPPR